MNKRVFNEETHRRLRVNQLVRLSFFWFRRAPTFGEQRYFTTQTALNRALTTQNVDDYGLLVSVMVVFEQQFAKPDRRPYHLQRLEGTEMPTAYMKNFINNRIRNGRKRKDEHDLSETEVKLPKRSQ